jgi:hypothetical protein
MGYTICFTGSIKINPPFTATEVAEFKAFSAQRHDAGSYPGIWCEWVPTPKGDAIAWNGAEKFYYSPEWMQYVVDRFVKVVPGRHANGEIEAYGEDDDDQWVLVVEDNVVTAPMVRREHRFHKLFERFLNLFQISD